MNSLSGKGVKRIWRKLDGVLLLDKPIGISSNQALQVARRLFNAHKGGHTGTLDPLATGLLPLCFGEATKFAGELLDADKAYTATLRLGVTTDTGDAEGREIKRREVTASHSDVLDALAHFRGDFEQIPPMYSALKRDGKPLYEYARAGIELERAPRKVTIRKLELTAWSVDQISIEVTCSKGTYIRTLAEDIGEQLHCGAHLSALRRTATGGMNVDTAITVAALEAMSEAQRDAILMPVDALISHLPMIHLDRDARNRVTHGQAFEATQAMLNSVPPAPTGEDVAGHAGRVRLIDQDGTFLGLGILGEDGSCQPHRLVATN